MAETCTAMNMKKNVLNMQEDVGLGLKTQVYMSSASNLERKLLKTQSFIDF